MSEGWDNYNRRFKRRSWNDWAKDLSALSGKRDVSQELTHEEEQEAFAEAYALAEMADGRAREQRPDEINE